MRNKILCFLLLFVAIVSCSPRTNVISVDTPKRPAGQESVLGLKADPIDTVRVGFIGLGMRGSHAVRRLTRVPDCKVTAICDIENDRVEKSANDLAKKGLPAPEMYGGDADGRIRLPRVQYLWGMESDRRYE